VTFELSKGGRRFCRAEAKKLNTLETDGQMLQRVMPELMGIKNILVMNDEGITVIGKSHSGFRTGSKGR